MEMVKKRFNSYRKRKKHYFNEFAEEGRVIIWFRDEKFLSYNFFYIPTDQMTIMFE